MTAHWTFPEHGLPAGDDYYVAAQHPDGGWGIGHSFSIRPRGDAAIQIRNPSEGEEVTKGSTIDLRYQFSEWVEEGPLVFELYQEDDDGRHGSPLLRLNRTHSPGPEGSPYEPIHIFALLFPRDLPTGDRFFITATHARAYGQSDLFSVQLPGDRGGFEPAYDDEEADPDERVGPRCDYGLHLVRFSGGGTLEDGLALPSGGTVSGSFLLFVRWNGIVVPAEYPPGTEFNYQITVRSKNTGMLLCSGDGATFSYDPADILHVHLPFSFDKDEIPSMSRGRFVPLEFTLEPLGESIDAQPDNNTLEADMRVLGATENDMEISLAHEDMELRRTPRAGPLDDYRLSQQFRVRNLSRNEAGGPPTLRDVTIRYCLDVRDEGEHYASTCAEGAGTFTMEDVGEEWRTMSHTHTFTERSPDDIPAGREYQFSLEVDPHDALIDTNRFNNIGKVRFTIRD
jgi:hypothetical protein